MQVTFKPMNQEEAEIIAGWHYDGIYSFYDMEADKEGHSLTFGRMTSNTVFPGSLLSNSFPP
ncbi:hypothetical protein SAMN04487909_12324 [Aneurinibacillus migulanus]|uniref:Uncharacterized protein n=1 Tax=Aneurinibacillus migulanus TaxID=47500 RepID=A0A1G8VCA3_ANEMI|nr:hypothetical protein AMI01nite_36350 [Aneurinibacillus migulanus]SDJ63721.1 hypothetical protein SAMN04487909_12324 [Aneurinibacillus migulanus]